VFTRGKLTWKCDICGVERPDAQISVEVHEVNVPKKYQGLMHRNVNHCNDNPHCTQEAKDDKWKEFPT